MRLTFGFTTQPGKNHKISKSSFFEFFSCQKHVIQQKYMFLHDIWHFSWHAVFLFRSKRSRFKIFGRDPTETTPPYGGKNPCVYTNFLNFFHHNVFFMRQKHCKSIWNHETSMPDILSHVFTSFFEKSILKTGVFPWLSNFRYFGWNITFFHFSQPIFIILR